MTSLDEKILISLPDYHEKVSKDPFNFDGRNYTIVPKQLVGSSIFNDVENYYKIQQKDLGKKERIEYISNMNFRGAELLNFDIGEISNSNIDFLFFGKVEKMSGLNKIEKYTFMFNF